MTQSLPWVTRVTGGKKESLWVVAILSDYQVHGCSTLTLIFYSVIDLIYRNNMLIEKYLTHSWVWSVGDSKIKNRWVTPPVRRGTGEHLHHWLNGVRIDTQFGPQFKEVEIDLHTTTLPPSEIDERREIKKKNPETPPLKETPCNRFFPPPLPKWCVYLLIIDWKPGLVTGLVPGSRSGKTLDPWDRPGTRSKTSNLL